MVGRAPPEVARSISNGGRVSERADGEEGRREGRENGKLNVGRSGLNS